MVFSYVQEITDSKKTAENVLKIHQNNFHYIRQAPMNRIRLNQSSEHVLSQITNNILNARELYFDIEQRTDGIYPVFSKILLIINTEIKTTENLTTNSFDLIHIWKIRDNIMKLSGFGDTSIKNLVESAFTMLNLMVDCFKF